MNRNLAFLALWLVVAAAQPARAAVIQLKDGRTLEGRITEVGGVAEDPTNPKIRGGAIAVTPILLVDDGLRRIYIHKSQIREILEQAQPKQVTIRLWQRVAEHGSPIARVGRSVQVTPFDQFGRRTFDLMGRDGPIHVVQGITEITPTYTRVQGLMVEPRSYIWDMRIATSSIPRETLGEILTHAVPRDDPDARLEIVRLYLESERYREARIELEKIVDEFPELSEQAQVVRQLRQMGARSILDELQMRAAAGQHQLVRQLLDNFPAEEVAGETLQQVREMVDVYDRSDARREQTLQQLNELTATIDDPIHREVVAEFVEEIAAQLSDDTDGRLTSFRQLADDDQMTAEQKMSLAVSGWLVGTNQATDNLAVTLALIEVREGVLAYLRSTDPVGRRQILAELHDLEGATVERVAELLKRIVPPLAVPEDAQLGPGYFKLAAAGLAGGDDVEYFVQLPPEYNPHRSYPTIVTLHGQGYAAPEQMNFWAGAPRDDAPRDDAPHGGGHRLGQAGRHGYITIAPAWQRPHQAKYGYTAREHHAVLSSLRSAMRHFSIDSNRVFLTGHDIGGDAAWDIALAHPDLWAGVMPLLAVGQRYVPRYWINGEYVAWYFVEGEKDADKMSRNSAEFDRYLRPSFDTTIVEFQGRGYEPFGDELQRLFDWMNRRKRRAAPEEFECSTMRPWDNFFWWLEVADLPPKTVVDPANWPPQGGSRPARLRGKILQNNKILVFANAGHTTVWLRPEVIDFDQQATIEINGRRAIGRDQSLQPSLDVLLEDTRTRGDRHHPFWAKVEL
jgi:pimeloyl-ACP methyl ester carboxylesterase